MRCVTCSPRSVHLSFLLGCYLLVGSLYSLIMSPPEPGPRPGLAWLTLSVDICSTELKPVSSWSLLFSRSLAPPREFPRGSLLSPSLGPSPQPQDPLGALSPTGPLSPAPLLQGSVLTRVESGRRLSSPWLVCPWASWRQLLFRTPLLGGAFWANEPRRVTGRQAGRPAGRAGDFPGRMFTAIISALPCRPTPSLLPSWAWLGLAPCAGRCVGEGHSEGGRLLVPSRLGPGWNPWK